MPQRMPRGIQYADVAQAADALLEQGARPTIERIRLHIGRGSPNTVSPMLEQWFANLGQRLGMRETTGQGTEIPETVLQTAKALWEKACAQAQMQSERACTAERVRLEGVARHLSDTQVQLDARESAVNERLQTMEAALQLCTQQVEECNARWQASQRALALKTAEVTANQSTLERSREHAALLQQRLDAAQIQARNEQSALHERHRSSERHWLAEVDRARQEARKALLLAQNSERRLGVQQQEADSFKAMCHAMELKQALQINTLSHELAMAVRNAEEMQLLLQRAQRQSAEQNEFLSKPRLVTQRPPPLKKRKLKRKSL